MNLAEYFQRIAYTGSSAATLATLKTLHYQHMQTIPFENLDVILKRPIRMDGAALFEKMVTRGRGGFCYEQNTLFGLSLRELGYQVDFISARVWNGTDFGRALEHIALIVHIEGERYLADVGFGDCFLEPLRLVAQEEQLVHGKNYRVIESESSHEWIMQEKSEDDWTNGYAFELHPRELRDFAEMCDWTQVSADSGFTQRLVCSKAVQNGRITIANMRLIRTQSAVKEEQNLSTSQDFAQALAEHFQIQFADNDLATLTNFIGYPEIETASQ